MALAFHKTITDSVHGNIALTELEIDIISSKVFQRLHNVRQLGLAHLVFPGAGYSRFAHSIGACHNAGKIIAAIKKNSTAAIDDTKEQTFRIAALLHDIGHYPYSHAMEHVIESYYTSGKISKIDSQEISLAGLTKEPPFYDHESLGDHIFDSDDELTNIFKKHEFDKINVRNIFEPSEYNKMRGIVSSDLDCDRLDYLRRTVHHSGAPYGSVDIDYLIEHATIDGEGRFCFEDKALRAADHLLIARYYDYLQIPFHKTVAALEWSLNTGIEELFSSGKVDCSSKEILKKINEDYWHYFDDQFMQMMFRQLLGEIGTSRNDETQIKSDHLRAILYRKPAKVLASSQLTGDLNDDRQKMQVKLVKAGLSAICKKYSIDERRIYIWTVPVKFTKIESSRLIELFTDDEKLEAVNIYNRVSKESKPLIHMKQSLMIHLSKMQYFGTRVYYLPPNGALDGLLRANLQQSFAELISDTH